MDDVTNGWLPEQYPKSKEAKLECNQYLNHAGDYLMIPEIISDHRLSISKSVYVGRIEVGNFKNINMIEKLLTTN